VEHAVHDRIGEALAAEFVPAEVMRAHGMS
jgi:hypothetical protein